MKKTLLSFAAVLLMAGFTTNVMAQATATASTSATIIAPIGIALVTDMNFGNIAVGTAAGTVILSPESARTASLVTLPAVTGTVSAAKFNVAGEDTRTYTVTLPSSVTITLGATVNTMTVNAFTSNPTVLAGLLGATGQELFVGATLNVGGSQVAGTYTNASDLSITVNYN